MEISKLPENAVIVAIQFNFLALHYGVLLIPNKNFYVLTFWKAVKSRQDLLHFLFNLVVLDMRATPS